jgi:hypothetical protein
VRSDLFCLRGKLVEGLSYCGGWGRILAVAWELGGQRRRDGRNPAVGWGLQTITGRSCWVIHHPSRGDRLQYRPREWS